MAATSLFNEPKETMPDSALIERPADVMSIIHAAVERGADPDQLNQLLTLQERVEKNEARKAYNRAMQACQEEMPAVVKNRMNDHTKKAYADLEGVTTTIKPIYTKHGFSLSYGSEQSETPGHIIVTCDCMHIDGHTEHRTLLCPYDTTGAKNPIQGMGSSTNYGRRYLLLMLFNVIVSDQDDDGNSGGVNKVGEESLRELDHWYSQIPEASQKGFLDYIGSDKLENIKASDFEKALDVLKRKVNKLKAEQR